MNITRDQFVQIINACIEQIDRDNEIADALDVVARDGANRSLVFSTRLIDKLVSAIDYEDTISWWLWDGPEAGKRAEEFATYLGDIDEPFSEKIVINNAGELYDYIEQQKIRSEIN